MKIKFTSDIEINNSLSFLDIKMVRSDSQFATSVYRKLALSGVFTNHESFRSKSFRFASIFTLIHIVL